MGKRNDQSVKDAALNKIATATRVCFCSAEPVNYAGIAAVLLCSKTGLTSGSFTLAAGDAGGTSRKVTLAPQSGMTPGNNGTVAYCCVDDGTTLLAGTTVTPQAVTTSQAWGSPAIKLLEISDPT